MIAAASDLPRPEVIRAAEIRKALDRDWRLIPLRGKKPLQKGWTKREPPCLEDLLAHAQSGNIGLLTGQGCGPIVLDDDTPEQDLASRLGLPPTVTVRTGSGRHHYYFRYPGGRLGNGRGALPPGVDVRGAGGVVVYPGSVHPETGEVYQWVPDRSPEEVEIADLPLNVLELIEPRRARRGTVVAPAKPRLLPGKRNRRLEAYATAAFANIEADIRNAPEGTRNETLNSGAFAVGRLVGAGLLAIEPVEAELRRAAEAAGLPPAEVTSTLGRALHDGIEQAPSIADLLTELDANTLGLPPADADHSHRPQVVLVDGERHLAVDAVMDVLRALDPPIVFEQHGRPVCLMTVRQSGLLRPHERAAVIQVRALDDEYLPDLLGRVIRFQRETSKGRGPLNCPTSFAKTIHARTPHGGFPPLRGVLSTPTLRPDGGVVDARGYDEATGIYLDVELGEFDGVPTEPTRCR